MEDEEYDENDPDPCDREFDRWRDRKLEDADTKGN
jgi:hypothetical protein